MLHYGFQNGISRIVRSRFLMVAPLALALVIEATPSYGWWIICKFKRTSEVGRALKAAKARLQDYASDPNSTEAQFKACKAVVDALTKKLAEGATDLALTTPNTTFTGPTNLKKLAKQVLDEIAKEILGSVALLTTGGFPQPLGDLGAGDYTRTEDTVAPRGYRSIPVGAVTEEMISTIELFIVSGSEYDGAEGLPPSGSDNYLPVLVLTGTFEGLGVDTFLVVSPNPTSEAFGGLEYDLSRLKADLGTDSSLATYALSGGLLERESLDLLSGSESAGGWEQVSLIEITEVDSDSGVISGRFLNIAAKRAIATSGIFDGELTVPSASGTSQESVLAADDFKIPRGNLWEIADITVQLAQDSEYLRAEAALELYVDRLGKPALDPIARFTSSDKSIVGVVAGMSVYEYVFDTGDLMVEGGRYWAAAYGLGDGSGTDRAFFASSGFDEVKLNPAYVRVASNGAQVWIPGKQVVGEDTDLAFSVNAIPRAIPRRFSANGHRYEIRRAPGPVADWNTARDLAESLVVFGVEGHLATISSEEENQFIVDLWLEQFSTTENRPPVLWLGGLPASGDWAWITNEVLGYQNWPNGLAPSPEENARLALQTETGQWTAQTLSATNWCVVEWDESAYVRSDANADSNIDLSDASYILNYMFIGGPAPSCMDAADSNDDGSVDLSDPVYILNFLFIGGPAPNQPYPMCGRDPTEDDIDCESYSACPE